jgi:predicted phosphate transport protein (TIGR00153 family)
MLEVGMARFSLRRRGGGFYGLFTRSARNLVTGTDLLAELALPGADVQSVSERLVELEHDSDQVTHEIYNKINTRRITPFDRADIYQLGSHLDDVMDHLEAAGTLVYLYGLTRLPALPREVHELVDVLNQQAELTADAMPRLESLSQLREYWIECNRLENEGDRAYRMLLVRLFSGEYDALTVLKMKEVADELEAACDAFEHVANTVETIAVKES